MKHDIIVEITRKKTNYRRSVTITSIKLGLRPIGGAILYKRLRNVQKECEDDIF